MENVDFEVCGLKGCRTKVVLIGGVRYQRKNIEGELTLVKHKCYVPPEAVRPDVLYYVEWRNLNTKRPRYSKIAHIFRNNLLRPPDIPSDIFNRGIRFNTDYRLIGVFRCEPKWTKLSESEVKKLIEEDEKND